EEKRIASGFQISVTKRKLEDEKRFGRKVLCSSAQQDIDLLKSSIGHKGPWFSLLVFAFGFYVVADFLVDLQVLGKL
ncbi:hypothetical protein IFM89_000297, partial [Coptis chinensis]